MTILGVWIFAGAVWCSSKTNGAHCWTSLAAAVLVSVFVK